jgi:hypothetical protein
MGIRSPVSCASNVASSNCASLKVEKVEGAEQRLDLVLPAVERLRH